MHDGVPRRRRETESSDKIFEELVAKNFPNLFQECKGGSSQ